MSPEITSDHELGVVQDAIELVNRTQPRFASLMRDVNWFPIPFFGSLASARILTFGLNPSAGEFAVGRSWPAQLSAEALAKRLVGYFKGEPDVTSRPHVPGRIIDPRSVS